MNEKNSAFMKQISDEAQKLKLSYDQSTEGPFVCVETEGHNILVKNYDMYILGITKSNKEAGAEGAEGEQEHQEATQITTL